MTHDKLLDIGTRLEPPPLGTGPARVWFSGTVAHASPGLFILAFPARGPVCNWNGRPTYGRTRTPGSATALPPPRSMGDPVPLQAAFNAVGVTKKARKHCVTRTSGLPQAAAATRLRRFAGEGDAVRGRRGERDEQPTPLRSTRRPGGAPPSPVCRRSQHTTLPPHPPPQRRHRRCGTPKESDVCGGPSGLLRQNRNGRACGAAAAAALDRLDRLCDDGGMCSAAQTRTPRSTGKARFGHGEAFRALSAVRSLGCGTIAQGGGDSPFGSPPAGRRIVVRRQHGTAVRVPALAARGAGGGESPATASRVGRSASLVRSFSACWAGSARRPVPALRPLSAARRGCVRRRGIPATSRRPAAGGAASQSFSRHLLATDVGRILQGAVSQSRGP